MIDVVNYLRELADNIESGNIAVERFETYDDLVKSTDFNNNKNKYIKTGISELSLTLRK